MYACASKGTDPAFPLEISVRSCWWPIITADQWLLPRFRVLIKNIGKKTLDASVQVDIAEHSTIPDFVVYEGPFQDVDHREIKKLDPGQRFKFTVRIESRFLKPTYYMLRLDIVRWVPALSVMEELERQFSQGARVREQEKQQARAIALDFLARHGVDPYERPKNQWRSELVNDCRWLEVIKVHSLERALTKISLVSALVASFLAFLGWLLQRILG